MLTSMHATAEPLLLTAEQVAECLSISRTRVYELIAADQLPSLKLGRSRRVPVAALRAYVDGLMAEAGTKDDGCAS